MVDRLGPCSRSVEPPRRRPQRPDARSPGPAGLAAIAGRRPSGRGRANRPLTGPGVRALRAGAARSATDRRWPGKPDLPRRRARPARRDPRRLDDRPTEPPPPLAVRWPSMSPHSRSGRTPADKRRSRRARPPAPSGRQTAPGRRWRRPRTALRPDPPSRGWPPWPPRARSRRATSTASDSFCTCTAAGTSARCASPGRLVQNRPEAKRPFVGRRAVRRIGINLAMGPGRGACKARQELLVPAVEQPHAFESWPWRPIPGARRPLCPRSRATFFRDGAGNTPRRKH